MYLLHKLFEVFGRRVLLLGLLALAMAGHSCKEDVPGPPDTPPVVPPVTPAAGPVVAPADAVVYEAFVRDFSAAGTFDGMLPRLDSIKSLGANVLWLMPIHPIGQVKRVGSVGSPYAVRDYLAANPDLGDLAAFDRLVVAAHQRNLTVILDWVANHTAWDHAWIQQHKDWYTQNAAGVIQTPVPEWQDVADLNYDRPELRREMIRAMRFWVQRHGVDGFRCDAADMVPDSFWKEAIDSLQRVRPNLFLLAEGGKASHLASGFKLNFGWDFYDALKQVFNQRAGVPTLTASHTREQQGAPAGRYRLRFTTNHDFSFTEGPAPEIFGSPAAAEAAYVATLAYGATPLIYNGQEAGDPARLSLFEKQTISWTARPATTAFYRRVLRLYHELPALRTGTITAGTSPDVVTVLRATGPQRVAVLVNVRAQPVTLAVPAAWPATSWTNALTGQPVANSPTLTLPAHGYAIWRSQ
ncbi:alpha-amylase family glycosyl hydrolase [Hymenobacter sp.]|uniref:alpha-amylase family glycosyl hydrolase n=1 Tax=Hymenobacter sp. TaxID=1898978 RepID=UPI00286CCA0A|nr:alpha-amylase family glycosyl hydrolase [Hymenobacter sp.]